MNNHSTVSRLLSTFGPFLALLVLVLGLYLAAGHHFCNYKNLSLILTQTAIVAIAACGMTLIIISGGIDLSVGSAMALTGVLSALAIHAGCPPIVAILVAIAAGAALGAINGGLIASMGIAPFIVTLGMLGMARGAAKLFAKEQSVDLNATSWLDKVMQPYPNDTDPAWLQWMVVAPGVWLAAIIALGMSFMMKRSVFGRHAYAIGSNEAGARLCGIRVRSTKVMIYVIAGALVGLAGLLEMTKLHLGDPTTAVGRELDVIAAVVIGGASLNGGVGTIMGTMIGALIMGVLRNGSQQLEFSTPTQEILIGAVIVIASAIDKLRTR